MGRTAVEIVRAYGVDAWTQGRDDLIPELCHDPIIRHDADREVRLSHAEQRARMRHNYEELRPVFEDVVLAGDDKHVTLVWNVTGRDPNWKWCGIEVFRVAESDALIARLYEEVKRPEHSVRFRWRKGSVAFWDNRAGLHYAVRDYGDFPREMHRVLIASDDIPHRVRKAT